MNQLQMNEDKKTKKKRKKISCISLMRTVDCKLVLNAEVLRKDQWKKNQSEKQCSVF